MPAYFICDGLRPFPCYEKVTAEIHSDDYDLPILYLCHKHYDELQRKEGR